MVIQVWQIHIKSKHSKKKHESDKMVIKLRRNQSHLMDSLIGESYECCGESENWSIKLIKKIWKNK